MRNVWLPVSYIWASSHGQPADTSPHRTIAVLSPTMVTQAGPPSTALNSGLLPHTHTHTHRNTCIPAADPLWCLIPPHFSRPLPLSNWSRSEYNYGENHPGLMWGWINGIKKIICWPSGPATVWGWEGNLKQKEEERRGALMSRRTESWWPLRALLGLSLQGLLSTRLPTTIAPYSSHLAKSFEGVQSNSEGAVK